MQANMLPAGFWPTRSLSLRLTEAEVRDLAGMDLRAPTLPTLTVCAVVGICREIATIWDRQPSPSGQPHPIRGDDDPRERGWFAWLWRHAPRWGQGRD